MPYDQDWEDFEYKETKSVSFNGKCQHCGKDGLHWLARYSNGPELYACEKCGRISFFYSYT